RFSIRIAIVVLALGLVMFPIHVARSEQSLDKSLSHNQPSDYYRETAEVRVEREGHIWSMVSVEGFGVQWSKTSLDFSGSEWVAFRWLRANARESRDPNEHNVWVDVNFELPKGGYPEDMEEVAHQIMTQVNSRLLITFEFGGTESWVDERDPNNVYDDIRMARVFYNAHVDFPWFVNELRESLPREMGGIAANIDVTDADEAWFEIYQRNNGEFFEQLGVGFDNFISELEGGHELAMEELAHLAKIERSEFAHDSWYYFNLPDVENLTSDPLIGPHEGEGYSVYDDRWYEGWQNAWRRGVSLDIHDPFIAFESFRVRFDYQFVPKALQTHEQAGINVDPFGNLDVWMGVQDPSATLTQSIDYEYDPLYESVEHIRLHVRQYEMVTEGVEPSEPVSSNTAKVEQDEPNIFLDIDFESDDPSYSSIADEIAVAHGADLEVWFEKGHEDTWDGRLHIHYYGWVDWNVIMERVKKPEISSKSALFDFINFQESQSIGSNIDFDDKSGLPRRGLGVHWWIPQHFVGSGEFYISTQIALNGYSPLRKLPAVDSSHFYIDVPGYIMDVVPHKDTWGEGFDVYHNEWDNDGIHYNQYGLHIFDEIIELEEFGVLFEFDFFEEGTDIRAPDINFRYPFQDERVSGTIRIEIEIYDDFSGVREDSVKLEVCSKYLLIDWTELKLYQEDDMRWTATWDTTELGGDGTYNLLVSALDHEGHRATAEISVEVDNIGDDSEPPIIEILKPYDGDTVSGDVTIFAEVYDPSGLQTVSLTIDGLGYTMEPTGTNEYSFTWDSTKRADGEHLIVVIATGMDGEEAKEDIMIVTDNGVTENVPPSELEQQPAFFIPGFSLLEVLIALSVLGLLLMTRKKRLV
ncbi:MAG: Ig-like domain-containing protein, partial [Candidatus Hodarchaeota archaeon]